MAGLALIRARYMVEEMGTDQLPREIFTRASSRFRNHLLTNLLF